MMIVFYVVWALNILALLFNINTKIKFAKNSKYSFDLLCLVSVLVSIYIYFNNTGSGDYKAYVKIYEGIYEFGYTTDVGFMFLMQVGHFFNLTFNQFQGITCTISLLLTLFVFSRFSKDYKLFFAVYFIYQYFMDMNVLRNFIARGIFALAFLQFYRQKKLSCTIWTILAALVHKSMFIYLVFPIFLMFNKQNLRKILTTCSLVILCACGVIFLLGNNFSWIYQIAKLIPFIDSNRLEVYFQSSTRFGFIIYFGLHFFNLYLNYRADKYIKYQSKEVQKIHHYSYMVNMFLLISFPLIMMNTDFHRLFTNLYLLNLVYYAMLLESCKHKKSSYVKTVIYILGINFCYLFPFVHGSEQGGNILKSLTK